MHGCGWLVPTLLLYFRDKRNSRRKGVQSLRSSVTQKQSEEEKESHPRFKETTTTKIGPDEMAVSGGAGQAGLGAKSRNSHGRWRRWWCDPCKGKEEAGILLFLFFCRSLGSLGSSGRWPEGQQGHHWTCWPREPPW